MAVLREIRFTYQHEGCWLQEATERHEGVTLVISSIYVVEDEVHGDLIVHAPNREVARRVEEELRADKRIRHLTKLFDGPRGTRYHVGYASERSIYPHILRHTPVSVGAISMTAGTEFYHLIGEQDDVQGLLAKLNEKGRARVTSVRNVRELPEPTSLADEAASVFDELTDKQLAALLLAHRSGYYSWPRTVSAQDLSERSGVSPPAFLEHLRRAEAKVLDAAVEAYRKRSPARAGAPRQS